MQEYLITLIETTTKTMLITAPSKNEAVETALLFHLGASDAERQRTDQVTHDPRGRFCSRRGSESL